jgi:hypothetical protein
MPTSVLLLSHADRGIHARVRTVSSGHVRAAGGIRVHWPTPARFASIGSTPQRLPSHIPLQCSPRSMHWSDVSGSSVRIAPREGSLSLPCIPLASVGEPCPTPSALENRATTRCFIPSEKEAGFLIGDYHPGTIFYRRGTSCLWPNDSSRTSPGSIR